MRLMTIAANFHSFCFSLASSSFDMRVVMNCHKWTKCGEYVFAYLQLAVYAVHHHEHRLLAGVKAHAVVGECLEAAVDACLEVGMFVTGA